MKDILGQEIAVGDWVAYPTSSGHTPMLKIGQVKSLVRNDWKRATYKGEEVIISWKIGIWAVEDTYSRLHKHKAQRTSYPNWQNVLKIDPPEDYRSDPVPE